MQCHCCLLRWDVHYESRVDFPVVQFKCLSHHAGSLQWHWYCCTSTLKIAIIQTAPSSNVLCVSWRCRQPSLQGSQCSTPFTCSTSLPIQYSTKCILSLLYHVIQGGLWSCLAFSGSWSKTYPSLSPTVVACTYWWFEVTVSRFYQLGLYSYMHITVYTKENVWQIKYSSVLSIALLVAFPRHCHKHHLHNGQWFPFFCCLVQWLKYYKYMYTLCHLLIST